MYQSLYRKYRPDCFADVYGQPHIVVTLKNQVANNRTAHAYLFTGSRGTGKTSCAKILAKAVNCPNMTDGEPCNNCEICRGIDSGSILDCLEIDAASNNGVENIRSLRDEVHYPPSRARYKVYIIDEVHMLSISAFNALLKTLEEPPSHCIFVLATTEVHKIPATIISRCQRFDFVRISSNVIADRLKFVAEKENIKITDSAAMLIAGISDGGMRDALSLLDLVSANRTELDADDVRKAAGLADDSYLFEIVDNIIKGDSASCLSILGELYAKSVDLSRFCEDLLVLFRNIMVVKTVRDPSDFLIGGFESERMLRQLADGLAPENISYALECISDVANKLAHSANKRVETEIMLIKLCNPVLNSSYGALVKRLTNLEEYIKNSGNLPLNTTDTAPDKKEKTKKERKNTQTDIIPDKPDKPDNEKSEKMLNWPEIVEEVKTVSKPIYSMLVNTEAELRGDRLFIIHSQSFLAEMLKNEDNMNIINKSAKKITGLDYIIELDEQAEKASDSDDKNSSDQLSKLAERAGELGIPVNYK